MFSAMARTVQARLLKGADIDALATLDRKDWLVLSCPIADLGEGQTVATLLDCDHDGRVRIPEILAAVDWLRPRLASFDLLFQPTEGLHENEIATTTEEGTLLTKVFHRLAPEGCLTEDAIEGAIETFRQQADNGDGVVPPTAAGETWAAVGETMIAVTGGAPAIDGTMGITRETLDAFIAARTAYLEWRQAEPTCDLPDIDAAHAVSTVEKMKAKIDAFFLACNMVRYNPATEANFVAPTTVDALVDAPLCLPGADRYELPFDKGINPLYLSEMATIAQIATTLDPTAEALDATLWEKVQAAVAPLSAWAAAKPASAEVFASLSEEVFAVAGDATMRTAFEGAIDADLAQAPLAAAFDDLRRLVVLRLHFLRFLRNFVNVEDLYPPTAKALFQVGTLYMDGRACSLCFPISLAPAAHATAAKKADCCLAYCTLKHEGKTRTICAVFTAGTANTLAVGRNGVFYDLEGQTWEATIVHLIANPMGLREAFFTPWKKMIEAFTGTLSKFISSKNDAATKSLTTSAESAAKNVTSGTKAPAPNTGMNMASVATLGIALSFLATAVTGIIAALTATPLWKTLCALLGLVCVVSLPSVILTWFKLRARDLAPILNASGWAINRPIGLTPALGRYFTQETRLLGKRFIPANLPRSSRWPKRIAVLLLVLLALTALWYFFCPTSPRQRQCCAKACATEEVIDCPTSAPTSTAVTPAPVAPTPGATPVAFPTTTGALPPPAPTPAPVAPTSPLEAK